jgi:hypothetical protein
MKIRLWKLGSLDHRIMPGPATFGKFRDILREASESGRQTFDIVWDPAISVQEIEVGPDGIDVPVGDVVFSDELRGKIERLIADHMRPASPAPELDGDVEAVFERVLDQYPLLYLKDIQENGVATGGDSQAIAFNAAPALPDGGISVPAFLDGQGGSSEFISVRPDSPSDGDSGKLGVIDSLVSVFMRGLRLNAERAGVDFSLVDSVEVFEDENQQRCRRYGWYGCLDADTYCVGSSVDILMKNFPRGVLPSEVTKRLRDEATAFVREQKALRSQPAPAGQMTVEKFADLRPVAETVSHGDDPVVTLDESALADVRAVIEKRVRASIWCDFEDDRTVDVPLPEPSRQYTLSELMVRGRLVKYPFDLSDSARAAMAETVAIGEPGLFTGGPREGRLPVGIDIETNEPRPACKKCDCPAENFSASGIGCVCGGV